MPGHRRRSGSSRALMALGGCFLLAAGTSFAAPDSRGTPPSIAATQADHECEALLLKVERQIADGHTATPPSDNALLTWQSVIERTEAASPGTRRALADFVERVTTRVAEERAAGRETVELDLKLFAGLAHELLARGSPLSGYQAAAAKPLVESDTPAVTCESLRHYTCHRPRRAGCRHRQDCAPVDKHTDRGRPGDGCLIRPPRGCDAGDQGHIGCPQVLRGCRQCRKRRSSHGTRQNLRSCLLADTARGRFETRPGVGDAVVPTRPPLLGTLMPRRRCGRWRGPPTEPSGGAEVAARGSPHD